jgi:uncharacterized membrane protein
MRRSCMEHQARTVVDRPLSAVYNQWTQFESFPAFMEGVKSVRQIDDSTTYWDVELGGVHREFTADIVAQQPDREIRWVTRDEPAHEGRVQFEPRGEETEVSLWMKFEPQGFVEKSGDALGFVQRRVEGDLDRFKTFIENRPTPTGAWRGNIPNDPAAGSRSSLGGEEQIR